MIRWQSLCTVCFPRGGQCKIVEDPRTRHRGHNGQGIKLLRDDCDCYMEPKPDEDAHVP